MLRSFETFAQRPVANGEAIEGLRERAPVHVVVVSGNHDTQRTYYLGSRSSTLLPQHSRGDHRQRPSQRKYVSWIIAT